MFKLKDEKQNDKIVRLELERVGAEIRLLGCSESVKSYALLRFSGDEIIRCVNIPNNIGLRVDSSGRIIISDV